jgi:hypothetical protein
MQFDSQMMSFPMNFILYDSMKFAHYFLVLPRLTTFWSISADQTTICERSFKIQSRDGQVNGQGNGQGNGHSRLDHTDISSTNDSVSRVLQ